MINKDQAQQIAEELLMQQRQQSLDDKNAAASRVPLLYQCVELNCLTPTERASVLLEARKAIWRGHWFATLATLIWIGFFSYFLLFELTPAQRSNSYMYWLVLLDVPPFVLYVSIVRLHVKYLASMGKRLERNE